MLGEAAVTMGQAERYFADYQNAIRAIGAESAGRGIYDGPGISIKLSALHPRTAAASSSGCRPSCCPRLKALAVLARGRHRPEHRRRGGRPAGDLARSARALCFEPELAGWHGIGFVVQAYQKRCPFVIDWLIDLAGRSGHRLMVRLVKGAYWDSEIKRAQVDGLEGYPGLHPQDPHRRLLPRLRRKLLAAPDASIPQFATHNAQTLSPRSTMARREAGRLRIPVPARHGREPLRGGGRPRQARRAVPHLCAGGHARDLLAYLVRRLLENGANTSFVNQIADPAFR